MNGTLPNWLAQWLGVAPASNADTVTWQLESTWHWAPWATLAVVMGLIAWTVLLYARETTPAGYRYRALLIGLRLAAFALVLIMLAEWALNVRLSGPPTIALVFDRSASMGIADRYEDIELAAQLAIRLNDAHLDGTTRLNLAKTLATEQNGRFLRELSARFRLEIYFASENCERASGAGSTEEKITLIRGLSSDGPGNQATRLGDSLREILDDFRGAPPTAIVLITDGVTTDGVPLASAAEKARISGVPLIAVGLGSEQPSKDIELTDVLVDEAVFVNDLVSLQIQIKSTGLEGKSAKLALRRDSDATPLMEQTITLPPNGATLTTQLVDRPNKPGDVNYVVDIESRDDEIDKVNNRQRRSVSVRDEKIRLLLVSGYPSFEFRFLKTLFERDPTIELAVYLQDADLEYSEQDKSALRAFPINREKLLEYDVLLIGDVDPLLLPRSTWHNIRDFVAEKGGGIAFVAGPRYLPLLLHGNPDMQMLLPFAPNAQLEENLGKSNVDSNGFGVRPTLLGLQSPVLQLGDTPAETEEIWSKLATLHWLASVGELKPAVQTLAITTALPVEHFDPQRTDPAAASAVDRRQSANRGSAELADVNPQAATPMICFQFIGPGRVLFHAIDSTWRWRLGARDDYFARYWVQAIRFLARGKLNSRQGANLMADRREYRPDDVVRLRARFFDMRFAPMDDNVTVFIDSAGQARRRETLRRNPTIDGAFEGSLTNLAPGRYDIVLTQPRLPGDAPSTRVTVAAAQGEMARVEMDSAALSAAAEMTGGKFYTIATADRLVSELPAGRHVPLVDRPPIAIWNRWWLLISFLSCITTEWILRKQNGML